jgi:hypothetical protein
MSRTALRHFLQGDTELAEHLMMQASDFPWREIVHDRPGLNPLGVTWCGGTSWAIREIGHGPRNYKHGDTRKQDEGTEE